MSRIGRMPVTVPSGVDVTIDGRSVTVRGPKGTLSMQVTEPIEVSHSDGVITVTRPSDEGEIRALHGLSRSLIANMVTGVTEGYRKTLEIVGVGYRVQPPGAGEPARRDHVPRRVPDQVHCRGNRQAAGR